MSQLFDLILVLHVVTVVLMAALVVVSERGKLGPSHIDADRLMERIVKGILWRCYFVQWTAVILGVVLVIEHPSLELGDILSNEQLLVKFGAWIVIMGIHNWIYFLLQPDIDRVFGPNAPDGTPDPADVAKAGRSRLLRKRGATGCLMLVLTAIIMAAQIHSPYDTEITAALFALAALFVFGAYRRGAPYGWI